MGLARLWRMVRPGGCLVLALHGVLPETEADLFNATGKFISPERMRDFLERLCRLYKPVSLEGFLEAMVSGGALKNRFVLTFDDGYANVYSEAFPLLRQMGIPFSVFVTTGMVDTDTVLWNDLLEFAVFSTTERTLHTQILQQPHGLESQADRRQAIVRMKRILKTRNVEEARKHVDQVCTVLGVDTDAPELDRVRFLSSDQIREMSGAGVDFGGHSVTHPILSKETPERVRAEIAGCKSSLESVTREPVTAFAYPNGQPGDFNDMVKGEVASAGYKAAFTGVPGLAYPGTDPFEIKRLLVDCRWTIEEFETRASGILEITGR
jgi:peptidoglycan/xylan/chitin deacetylase (PgdA/CDA1 family)